MSLTTEAVSAALEDFRMIKETIERIAQTTPRDGEKFGSKFRTRAVDMPSFIAACGLLPTLTLYYAKAGPKYQDTVALLKGKETRELDGDNFAYGACLYLVLNRLAKLGFLEDATPNEPLTCFEKLAQVRPLKLSMILSRLIPYLLEIKKLSEAEFKPER